MEQAIEAVGLVKKYPKGVTALDGLSFAVAPGRVFALLGPNGAGKSTAVKILTTLATPDSGRALVGRLDVVSNPDAVRRIIGVVAQGSAVDIQATGRENLRLQGQIYGLRGPALAQRAEELLERFGLADAADRIARGYSGGMQRRLDIAMALVHDPEVLFLDEPTSGLDPTATHEVIGLMATLAREHGRTIMLCTHFLAEASRLCRRVAILQHGRLVAFGRPADLAASLWPGVAVDLELGAAPDERALAALRALGGVLSAEPLVGGARVWVSEREVLAQVVASLVTREIAVYSVVPRPPTLEDIYFALTGAPLGAL
jgi:ABC-2 type transport system ATP-binding protein